jgi:hypothetical protein
MHVGAQAVVTRHLHHRSTSGARGNPERIPRTLHDQGRDLHGVQLVQAARCRRRSRPARRLERERQAEHRDGASRFRGAARNPRAERPAADDERQPSQLTFARDQMLDHRRPGSVELASRSGRAAPGNTVGLLDQGDAEPFRKCDVCHGNEVSRAHAACSAVAEDEGGSRLGDRMQMDDCATVRGVYREHVVQMMLTCSIHRGAGDEFPTEGRS